ncbi:MAG: hypothetical protein NVSMB31_21020 [Vulcanimicrobiaceae bacterium]
MDPPYSGVSGSSYPGTYNEALRLSSAGYTTIRRLRGTHPLEGIMAEVPSDIFDASEFEERARRESRCRNRTA